MSTEAPYSIPACTIPDCPRESQLCRHEIRSALTVALPLDHWINHRAASAILADLLDHEMPS